MRVDVDIRDDARASERAKRSDANEDGSSETDDEVARLEEIYRGPLSVVFRGRYRARLVAIKRPKLRTKKEMDRYHAELTLARTCAHERVVNLVAARALPPNYELVYEWMENGSVADAMYVRGLVPTWRAALRVASDVASGLAYLHSLGVVHRDVKPSNVLLDRAWRGKISDFGLAEYESELRASVQAGIYSTEDAEGKTRADGTWIEGARGAPTGGFQKQHMVGSMPYMAPEVLMRKVSGFKSDVYAFAVTLCEIATGTAPYSDRARNVALAHTVLDASYNEQDLAIAIASEHLRPVLPRDGSRAGVVPEGVNELIERAWSGVEASRPTCADVCAALDIIVERYCAAHDLDDTSAVWLPPASHRAANAERASSALGEPLNWPSRAPAFKSPSEAGRAAATAFAAGAFSTPGARGADKMEDRVVNHPRLGGFDHAQLFAVFDGHRGSEAAEFAMVNIASAVVSEWGSHGDDIGAALSAAMVKVDKAFVERFDAVKQREMSASKNAQQSARNPGCTANVCLIWGDRLCVANAGDCRSILSRNGEPLALSIDHSAHTNASERARIVEAHGEGALRQHNGVWRVGDAGVAVTRAIGDADAKPFGVIAVPETVEITLDPTTDDVVVVACDGLWDVVNNAEALALVKDTVKEPSMCAKRLGSEALARLSGDNITVIVGFLSGARTCENVSWARAF